MAKLELEIDFEKLGQALAEHDFVEVVRCKDCKHWEYDVIFQDGWCRGKRQGNPDWYCADGERRDG